MAESPQPGMFRKQSLDKLTSPDRLDQLLRVVRRRDWLPLVVIAGLLGVAVAWGFLGRIPLTTDAKSMLVFPRRVIPFQAPGSGQILSLDVRVGERVKKGQLLGTINLPEMKAQLEAEESRLRELQTRTATMSEFEKQQALREQEYIQRQRTMIEARIAQARKMAEQMLELSGSYAGRQRETLGKTKDLAQELDGALRERFDSYMSLKEEGLSSADIVVNSKRAWIENRLRLADVAVQVHALELRELEGKESYLRQLDSVSELEIRLEDLKLREASIERRLLEASLDNASRAQELERSIARSKHTLEISSRILADYDARIVEITASVGNIVSAGTRIGTLETADETKPLMALTYVPAAEGKKIKPGMRVRVSPTTVERERYGSILGRVTSISDFPVTTDAATNEVGNRELANSMTQGGTQIEAFIELDVDPSTPSGYRWTSREGPPETLSAGTMAASRVTIEEQVPITLVIPALRSWLGL